MRRDASHSPSTAWRSFACAGAMALAMFAAPRGAEAQQPSAADRALAQSLFDDGRRLMALGEAQEACAKFEASQRLDPGGGTLLNLASCHEAIGRTATAWTEFNEGLSQAIRDARPERERLCRQHITALSARLVRLAVSPGPNAQLDQFTVSVDGAPLAQAAWNVAVPVDPGDHAVAASAPGHAEWKLTVKVAERDAPRIVHVPPLERLPDTPVVAAPPTAIAPSDAPPPAPTGWQTKHTAMVVGGTAVVALAVGTVFGVMSLDKGAASNALCQNGKCTPEGLALYDEARAHAWGANIGIGVGIAAAAVATFLFLQPSGASRAASPAAATVTPTGLRFRF